MIAELKDKFGGGYGFIDRLYQAEAHPPGWIDLLNAEQRSAIADALSLIGKHPEYRPESDEIAVAVERLRSTSS